MGNAITTISYTHEPITKLDNSRNLYHESYSDNWHFYSHHDF